MAAITAAFVTQPVFGSVIDLDHQLIFTENSSSSLSATYDGATLTPTFVSTDEWTLQTNVRSLFASRSVALNGASLSAHSKYSTRWFRLKPLPAIP